MNRVEDRQNTDLSLPNVNFSPVEQAVRPVSLGTFYHGNLIQASSGEPDLLFESQMAIFL